MNGVIDLGTYQLALNSLEIDVQLQHVSALPVVNRQFYCLTIWLQLGFADLEGTPAGLPFIDRKLSLSE